MLYFIISFLLLFHSSNVSSFGTIQPISQSWTSATRLFDSKNRIKRKQYYNILSPSSALYLAGAQITTPSPEEAANMGARDWPQQVKKGTWIEEVSQGDVKIRYVLEGEGSLSISSDDASVSSKRSVVGPGTLVEATGPVRLEWTVKNKEMIILTPGYEQQGLLFAVAGLFLVLCGSLVMLS